MDENLKDTKDLVIEENETNEETSKNSDSNQDLTGIFDSLNDITVKLDEMTSLFESKIKNTSHEEKIVDRMHSELQEYKNDIYSQLVRPIFRDIIDVRNSMLQMIKVYEAKAEEEQNIPLKTFTLYAYEIQDMLEKNDIYIYEGQEGDDFSPSKQRVIEKVETSEEVLHGKIAKSLAPGYEYLGKAFSPEKVAAYIYIQDDEEEKGDN